MKKSVTLLLTILLLIASTVSVFAYAEEVALPAKHTNVVIAGGMAGAECKLTFDTTETIPAGWGEGVVWYLYDNAQKPTEVGAEDPFTPLGETTYHQTSIKILDSYVGKYLCATKYWYGGADLAWAPQTAYVYSNRVLVTASLLHELTSVSIVSAAAGIETQITTDYIGEGSFKTEWLIADDINGLNEKDYIMPKKCQNKLKFYMPFSIKGKFIKCKVSVIAKKESVEDVDVIEGTAISSYIEVIAPPPAPKNVVIAGNETGKKSVLTYNADGLEGTDGILWYFVKGYIDGTDLNKFSKEELEDMGMKFIDTKLYHVKEITVPLDAEGYYMCAAVGKYDASYKYISVLTFSNVLLIKKPDEKKDDIVDNKPINEKGCKSSAASNGSIVLLGLMFAGLLFKKSSANQR